MQFVILYTQTYTSKLGFIPYQCLLITDVSIRVTGFGNPLPQTLDRSPGFSHFWVKVGLNGQVTRIPVIH